MSVICNCFHKIKMIRPTFCLVYAPQIFFFSLFFFWKTPVLIISLRQIWHKKFPFICSWLEEVQGFRSLSILLGLVTVSIGCRFHPHFQKARYTKSKQTLPLWIINCNVTQPKATKPSCKTSNKWWDIRITSIIYRQRWNFQYYPAVACVVGWFMQFDPSSTMLHAFEPPPQI